MKKLLCLAALVVCLHHFNHPGADPASLDHWNKERRQAEVRLQGEALTYQAWSQSAPGPCPRAAAAYRQQIYQQGGRLETAKAEAIHVLEQKPGVLTVREAWQLNHLRGAPARMEPSSLVVADNL